MNDLAILTAYWNFTQSRNILRNYYRFRDDLLGMGLPLYVMELCGWRGPEIYIIGENHYLAYSETLLWPKERMLNRLEKLVPAQYTKVAWIDADVLFGDADWYAKASALLDRYKMVQLFNYSLYDDVGIRQGAVSQYYDRWPMPGESPGLAWAARRELFQVCGLYDACPVGGNDTRLWQALRGNFHFSRINPAPPIYRDYEEWARKIHAWCEGSFYFLDTTVYHLWHGFRKDRQYIPRYNLVPAIDPDRDLVVGSSGMTEFVEPNGELARKFREYWESRNPDAPPPDWRLKFKR